MALALTKYSNHCGVTGFLIRDMTLFLQPIMVAALVDIAQTSWSPHLKYLHHLVAEVVDDLHGDAA